MEPKDRYGQFDEDAPRDARISPQVALIGVLLLGGVLWLATLKGGRLNPVSLGLGVFSELAAVRLGAFGFFSYSAGFFLAAALQSPGLTAFSLLGALLGRTLLRSGGSASERVLELVADLLPLVMLLFFSVFTKGLELGAAQAGLCAVGFWLIWWFTPGLFQACLDPGLFLNWSRCRSQLLAAAAAQVCCGLWVFYDPIRGWLALPVLWALVDSARRIPMQVKASLDQGLRDKAEARLSVDQRELSIHRSSQAVEETKLEVQMDSYRLVERMLSSLRHSPSLKSVALAVLEQVRTRVPCDSVAIFLESEGSLRVVASITSDQQRVESASIMGFRESLVERTWQRGRFETLSDEDLKDPQRIFMADASGAAAPISNRGALYVGNSKAYQLSSRETQYLDSLARHSWLALQAAQSQEQQQAAYLRELSARQVSEKLLNRLADLVAGMNELLAFSEPQQLVRAGAALLGRLLRAPGCWVHFRGIEENSLQGPLDGIHELALSSLRTQRPILHSEYRSSPFFRIGSPYACVLVVPVKVQEEGVSFLIAASEHALEREDQDILTLMGLQLGPLLETVRLYFDLQIAHQRLAESQAQLVQSSKLAAIGQLAGGVAHELNTPLGAVTVALDAVGINLNNPEKARDRLEKARKSCQKMKGIISKLLFYSRDSTNRKEQTDLNKVLDDTLDFIGSQIRLDNVEIEVSKQPLPSVMANQNEIQQILINLLNNAKDAVLSDGSCQKKIVVSTCLNARECCIDVRDFGPGVPEDLVERIFDPFFTTKQVGQGTGLGLSVSMQLSQQNGGSLAILMHSGPGAHFRLKLPQMDGTGSS